jgi:Ca2+-binding EF-hand superfamily protein
MGGQVQKIFKGEENTIEPINTAMIDQFFHKHDTDRDNYLTNEELKIAILDYIHIHPEYEECLTELLNSLPDKEFMTSLEIFRLLIRIYTCKQFNENDYIVDIFKILDKKSCGYFEADQLCHVFTNLGLNMTKQEASEIIVDIDEDKDCVIDLEDFVKTMISK